MPPVSDCHDAKRALRAAARLQRARLASASARAAAAVRDAVLTTVPLADHDVVAGYWPMGDEFDVRPLLAALAARGHRLALPVVVARAAPLVFRAWAAGDPLMAGGFGISVPLPGQPELEPELVLVPLLAFDARGYRLGYGGGFYDRTLARLRARARVVAIGIGFAGQEIDAVPNDATDQRLDWIVTERDARRIAATEAA
jgi:5-formyltetrahydrofolate cyclo-ligase